MIFLANRPVLALLLAAAPIAVLGGEAVGKVVAIDNAVDRPSLRALAKSCECARTPPPPCVCPDRVTEILQWQDSETCCTVYETCPDTNKPCVPDVSCANFQCLIESPPCNCKDGSSQVSAIYPCCAVYPTCEKETEPCVPGGSTTETTAVAAGGSTTNAGATTTPPPTTTTDGGVACLADVDVCSDGSFVSRDPKNDCAFYACPCAEKAYECPDGSSVGGDPNRDCKVLCSDHEKATYTNAEAKCSAGEVLTWAEDVSPGKIVTYPTAWRVTERIHDGETPEFAYGKRKIKLTDYAVHPIGKGDILESTGVLYIWGGTRRNAPAHKRDVTLFVECRDKTKDCSIYDVEPTCETSETDPYY